MDLIWRCKHGLKCRNGHALGFPQIDSKKMFVPPKPTKRATFSEASKNPRHGLFPLFVFPQAVTEEIQLRPWLSLEVTDDVSHLKIF